MFCLVFVFVFRKRENLITIFEKMSWISRSHFSSLVFFHMFMYLCMYYLIEAAYNLLVDYKTHYLPHCEILGFLIIIFFFGSKICLNFEPHYSHTTSVFFPGCLVVNCAGKISTSKHQLCCILLWGQSLAALAHCY